MMVTAVLISPELNALGLSAGTWVARVLWWAVGGLSLLSAISYTRLGVACVTEADQNHENSRTGRAA